LVELVALVFVDGHGDGLPEAVSVVARGLREMDLRVAPEPKPWHLRGRLLSGCHGGCRPAFRG
jgi:hypothetical protein